MRWTKSTYRKARRTHIARALDIKDQLDKNPTDDELLWAYYNTVYVTRRIVMRGKRERAMWTKVE